MSRIAWCFFKISCRSESSNYKLGQNCVGSQQGQTLDGISDENEQFVDKLIKCVDTISAWQLRQTVLLQENYIDIAACLIVCTITKKYFQMAVYKRKGSCLRQLIICWMDTCLSTRSKDVQGKAGHGK